MILFIDDEPRRVQTYLDELRYSYEVSFVANVDDGIRKFEASIHEIDLLILDIMMDHGTLFGKEESHQGLDTGILFYELVRRRAPDLPVIILTNTPGEEIAAKLRKDEKCIFVLKKKCPPDELPLIVKDFLSQSSVLDAMEYSN